MTYKQGCAKANADALSRLPLTGTPTVTPIPIETINLMSMLSQTPVFA